MSKYVATISTPGYMPTSEAPPVFDTPADAWWHLYAERCDEERDAPCDLCDDTLSHGPCGDCDDDSETADALSAMARHAKSDFEAVGTVYGPTPGYGGDYDLGLAYSVSEVEEEH